MRYGSVCSGIEAASVAWHSLGWEPVFFSEIESFPCAVLKHYYPTVPNHGDMTKFKEWPDESIDVLVGGTPCQSFSVAGLRAGLADPRGNLMLTYLAIADRYRPEWLVWENVPGVLSSNGGRDFGTFLQGVGELGYGFAYRILDAQYFGVAQRRRRVFVVANARGWQRAAAVLFERESLRGNPAPSREAGKDVAGTIAARFGNSRNNLEEIAPTLQAHDGDKWGSNQWVDEGKAVVQPVAQCLTSVQRFDPTVETLITSEVAETLIATDHKGPGHNRDHNFVAQSVTQFGDVAGSLIARHDSSPCVDRGQNVVAQPMASDQTAGTLRANPGSGWRSNGTPVEGVAIQAMQVRRLTPTECERLQGFPDGYTNIPWRKATESPDGPRYKALGNSMAVPVMNWIGQRIQKVSEL